MLAGAREIDEVAVRSSASVVERPVLELASADQSFELEDGSGWG